MKGALAGGAAAFIVGFGGAMLLHPASNLAPLAGLFTGPLGFLAGGLYASLVSKLDWKPRKGLGFGVLLGLLLASPAVDRQHLGELLQWAALTIGVCATSGWVAGHRSAGPAAE